MEGNEALHTIVILLKCRKIVEKQKCDGVGGCHDNSTIPQFSKSGEDQGIVNKEKEIEEVWMTRDRKWNETAQRHKF